MKKHGHYKTALGVVLLLLVLLLSTSCSPVVVAATGNTIKLAALANSCGGWLVYGDTVYEAIPASGYTCSYTFNGLSGDTIDIRLVKRTNTLDPYLELYDPYGTLIAYDDDGGGNSNSWIRSQSLSDTGTYTIVASGYNLASSGQFMLTLTQD